MNGRGPAVRTSGRAGGRTGAPARPSAPGARRRRAAALALTAGALWAVPRYLPPAVVSLRKRIFAEVNGDREVTVPGPRFGADAFARIYSDPAAGGRSEGAGLSDLFWYWLAPGPEVHQEHLENGPRYEEVARTTRAILAGPSRDVEERARRCAARVLDDLPREQVSWVRLRDLMMPVWAEFAYELVFDEPCPPHARRLIVANADDVITALKCTGLRHPRRRARLTRYLLRRLAAGDVPHALPASLSRRECAYYLQGTFFNTAVVQLSEAMAHLLLVLAQHPEVQDRLGGGDPEHDRDRAGGAGTEDGGAAERPYLDRVLEETFRLYPLFGIAHRIATDDIAVDEHTTVPRGTVLCFDYAAYEQSGFADPEVFDPDRWRGVAVKDTRHIPFGIAANRPCPAWRVAPLAMRGATRAVLDRFRLRSSVRHTRSLPHRAPCLLLPAGHRVSEPGVRARLSAMRVRDRTEDVWRSVAQLAFGAWMVHDARRLGLCRNHFARERGARPATGTAGTPGDPAGTGRGRCPVSGAG